MRHLRSPPSVLQRSCGPSIKRTLAAVHDLHACMPLCQCMLADLLTWVRSPCAALYVIAVILIGSLAILGAVHIGHAMRLNYHLGSFRT
jgi:hypothetical protein